MYRYSNHTLAKIKQHIANGGVIAYPTESCYGFGCDPLNRKAIDSVIKLKKRSKNKGMIVIASSKSQLNKIIKPLDTKSYNAVDEYWPGPYSLILKTKYNVPKNLIGKYSKIAVRVTKHELVKQICNSLGYPIISTSANISGKRSIKTYRECYKQFGSKVLVLPGLIGFAKKPSTIIDWETRTVLR
jgi:L-threonylcarbamoyladenylate synthase